MTEPVRVLFVDDDALVRRWLGMIVRPQDDLKMVGEAADGASAVSLVRQLRPDVVVTDIRMAPIDGIELTKRILATDPNTKVLVLTTFDLDEYVYGALRAGASGFLLKSASAEELLTGIRCIASGEGLLSPSVTRKLIDAFASALAPDSRADILCEITDRERDVLIAVSRGLTNNEIAEQLHISVPTTKTHVSRLLRKFAVRERAQLVIIAYECGLAIAGRAADDRRWRRTAPPSG